MNLKSQRSQKNIILIILCAVLVIMGVGYAAFSSVLTINGTANITNSWCVGFDTTKTNTYEVTKGLSFGTTPTGSMSYSGTACETNYKPTATLSNIFYQPGDQIEYTLTIKNKSSVTAAIKSIQVENDTVSSNTTITKENITYIVNMPDSTTLASNAETTMTVIAKFQDDTPIESGYTGEEQSLSVGINVEQDDGNGGMVITEPKFTGSIYRWNDTNAHNGDSIVTETKSVWCEVNEDENYNSCTNENWGVDTEQVCISDIDGWNGATCEQGTITTGVGEYTTDASTLNKTHYLKHDVVDDIITNSYVCFVYNNAEHCMKGGDGGASFAANTQIIKDFQAFYNLGAYSNGTGCNFDSSSSYCYGGVYHVHAASDGDLSVDVSSNVHCGVSFDGESSCYE